MHIYPRWYVNRVETAMCPFMSAPFGFESTQESIACRNIFGALGAFNAIRGMPGPSQNSVECQHIITRRSRSDLILVRHPISIEWYVIDFKSVRQRNRPHDLAIDWRPACAFFAKIIESDLDASFPMRRNIKFAPVQATQSHGF